MIIYDEFIQKLIKLHQNRVDLISLINDYLQMNDSGDLKKIERLKSWLDSFRPLSPIIVAELKKLYDVQLTYNSNAIEGNTLTQSETELVLTTGITVGGKTLQEHLEVIGHKDAIDYIETLAQQDTRINEWKIKQIHNLILRTIVPEEAGKYRQLDVKAAGTNYLYPAHYLLPQLMTDFVEWLNSKSARQLHPIDFATTAHYRFVTIHPFRDGNGRTARLIMNLLLMRAGYPIVIISNQIRNEYINAIAFAQQNQDDLSQLLNLVVNATKNSLIETLRLLVTATENKDKGQEFYQEISDFLDNLIEKY